MTSTSAASGDAAEVPALLDRGDRIAAVAFGAVLLSAFVYYLHLGRNFWFFSDEWDQLATRSATDVDDLLRAHNDHIQLIPTLVYRGLFRVFGLESYLPFQLPVLVCFLSTALLLRVVVRRAGVSPWVATVTCTAYVLLGSCVENILFGIQVSMMGSVVSGLAALVLLDRGRGDRIVARDGWAVVLCVVSLLCSGVGVTMVGIAGLTVLLRRGWRPALGIVAVPAALYLAWSAFYGTSRLRPGSLGTWLRFVWGGVESTFLGIGQHRAVAIALALLIVGGAAVLVADERRRSQGSVRAAATTLVRHRYALPAAMLIGSFAIIAYSGLGRAGPFGADSARSPRYFALSITLLLPALAVTADAVARRSRVAGVLVVFVLLAGVPGNIEAGVDHVRGRVVWIEQARDLMVALPAAPGADAAPDDLRPMPESVNAPDMTMGFLRRAVEEGWLHDASDVKVDPFVARQAALRISLHQTDAPDGPDGTCEGLGSPGEPGRALLLDAGRWLHLDGGFVTVEALDEQGRTFSPAVRATYNPNRGDALEVLQGPLQVRLTSGGINGEGFLCSVG